MPEQFTDKSSLSRYRAASLEIFRLLIDICGEKAVEKASVDEAYIDVSAMVQALLTDGCIKEAAGGGGGGGGNGGKAAVVRGWMGVGAENNNENNDDHDDATEGDYDGENDGTSKHHHHHHHQQRPSQQAYARHARQALAAVWAQAGRGRWAVIGGQGKEVKPAASAANDSKASDNNASVSSRAAAADACATSDLSGEVDGPPPSSSSSSSAAAAGDGSSPSSAAPAATSSEDKSRWSEALVDAAELEAGCSTSNTTASSSGSSSGGKSAAASSSSKTARLYSRPAWLSSANNTSSDVTTPAISLSDRSILSPSSSHDAAIAAGAVIASYIRHRVFTQLRFTCSAGVS